MLTVQRNSGISVMFACVNYVIFIGIWSAPSMFTANKPVYCFTPAGLTPCHHSTGRCRPSLTSMSCVLRCSRVLTTELTMRRRGAEEPSKLHRRVIRSSRWDSNMLYIYIFKKCCFRNIGAKSEDTCCGSLPLASSQFDFIPHTVPLYSCVVTQRGSRSPSRFSLEQLTTDQSGHILSIRYTGTQLFFKNDSQASSCHTLIFKACTTYCIFIIWPLWL